jgi:DNA invertase Pin-like site-specific DNA recombinase
MEQFIVLKRVSTRGQAESGLGLSAQQRDVDLYLNNYAETPHQIIANYTEISSGSAKTRPIFDEAVELARKTGATLLCSKIDRISRKVSVISTLIEDKKIKLRVATMPNADNFQLHIYSALAEQEREFISTRTKVALAEYKAKGGKLGGARPEQQKMHQANRDKANTNALRVENVIKLNRKNGNSYQTIAKILNEMKVETARGGKWHMGTVRRYDLRLLELQNRERY